MQITPAIKQQLLQVLMNLFWKYGLSLKKTTTSNPHPSATSQYVRPSVCLSFHNTFPALDSTKKCQSCIKILTTAASGISIVCI